jgi:hypothetical protein
MGVDQVLTSAARGFAPGAAQAVQNDVTDLLALPARALTDQGASRGRTRRVVARLREFLDGDLGSDAPALSPRDGPVSGPSSAAPSPQKTAAWVHHHLALGSISRAARVLMALPLAPPTAATLASRAALHPREAPPHVPPACAPAPVVTEEAFQRVLERLQRGSAPGLSRWTCDHLRAATGTSPTATTAILALMNLIISGTLPDIPSLYASALIAFAKPGGHGVRPIAMIRFISARMAVVAVGEVPVAARRWSYVHPLRPDAEPRWRRSRTRWKASSVTTGAGADAGGTWGGASRGCRATRVLIFTERDGRKGPPAGNKAKCNCTNTQHSRATQSEAEPETPNPHTGQETRVIIYFYSLAVWLVSAIASCFFFWLAGLFFQLSL